MTKKRILIVDDDVSGTCLLKLSLEKTGKFEVRTENLGARGLSAAREFRPDLILLDVVMPDKDGGDVAFHIQSDRTLSDTPIVFLTSLVTDNEAGAALLPGFHFIAKPASIPRLTEQMEKIMAEREEARQAAKMSQAAF